MVATSHLLGINARGEAVVNWLERRAIAAKSCTMRYVVALILPILTAACSGGAGRVAPQPAVVVQAPKPPPPVVQAPPLPNLSGNWEDWPRVQGDWTYQRDAKGGLASFGHPSTGPLFTMQCDRAGQRMILARSGAFAEGVSGRMSVRATSALQTYPVTNSPDRPGFVTATLATRDPQLDAMVFSRGKFVVSIKGSTDLVIPAWAEIARIVEDCRA